MVNEMDEQVLKQINNMLVMPNVPAYGATLQAIDKNAQVHIAINGWNIQCPDFIYIPINTNS
jgi:hypothetical protein